jgi:hypothetical protein
MIAVDYDHRYQWRMGLGSLSDLTMPAEPKKP